MRARIFAAREDRQQQHFGLRQLFAELLHDRRHALGDLFHGVVFAVGVIGADHDDGGPGLEAIQITVIKSPEDMLRAVAADAKIDSIAVRVILRPHFLSFAFPPLRDGVADENDLRLVTGFGGAFVQQFLPVLPALIGARGWFDGGMSEGTNG